MMEVNITPSKNDRGLQLLLPLYHFLQNTCMEAAIWLFVRDFKNAQYIKDNIHTHVMPNMRLVDLLHQINGKARINEKKKEKGKGARCQQQQQQTPQARRPQQIANIKENHDILSQVTVHNLLEANFEECKILLDLDSIFLLNVIINETIQYKLSDSLLAALIQIKDIRTILYHPKYNFTENDFETSLRGLYEAMQVLYMHLGYSAGTLETEVSKCSEEAKHPDQNVLQIMEELRSEVHKKYVVPHHYIAPNIVNTQEPSEPVIEDLVKFIGNQRNTRADEKSPVLLCGSRGTGKSELLQSLAVSFSQAHTDSASGFLLVLHLDDWRRQQWSQQYSWTRDIETEFWDQIFKCVKSLAPDSVSTHGLDSVKAVIQMNMDQVLFLINWDINIVGPLRKEMKCGTWVISHHGLHFPSVDWQILRVEQYEEMQVMQILESLNPENSENVLCMYEACEYKGILTSLDMIKVFNEMRNNVTTGTDFEIAELYVYKKLNSCMGIDKESTITKLGEIAFNAICKNRRVLRENELCNIPSEFKARFLECHEERGSSFIHLIIQDFMAAKYVISQPRKACQEWLYNVRSFKRVFKFACSMWCRCQNQLEVNIHHIKDYLIILFDIKSLTGEKLANRNSGQEKEPMEICGNKKKPKTSKKIPVFENPLKNPFTHWGFMLHLDDACHGRRQILALLAHLLSHIPCWLIKAEKHWDDGKLKRLEKVLNRVELKKRFPVTLRLESGTDTTMLVKIWNKIKNMRSLHDCCHVTMVVKYDKSVPWVHQDNIAELFDVIASAYSPVYITQYTGPFLCSYIPDFMKCLCMRKLKRLNVSVYDVASLIEVLSCKSLDFLKAISIRVDLKVSEQALTQNCSIEIPRHVKLDLTIRYFENIQDLLSGFKFCHRLSSLSIHDLYVSNKFELNLSAFKGLESLNIRFEPYMGEGVEGERGKIDLNRMTMDIDEPLNVLAEMQILPRCNWMFSLAMHLCLPANLERLLLRNAEFYNNSNNHLLLNFFRNYKIHRLVILDSLLSLKGARQIVSTHSSIGDDLEAMTKKLKVDKFSSPEIRKLIAKKPRLSKEEREQRKINKPIGKEIIISSELSLCTNCKDFPCRCTPQAGVDNSDTFEDLIYLIEDIYWYDVLSFTYTSNIFTIRKDICGDLRVHCVITWLDDATVRERDSSNTWVSKLLLTLTLAQCICFDYTRLSYRGVLDIISHLKKVKEIHSPGEKVEPFSLRIGSICHPATDADLSLIIDVIKKENCLANFQFWCRCSDICHTVKKTYSGKIYLNDVITDENVS